jgi:uncharacterized protein DUF5694
LLTYIAIALAPILIPATSVERPTLLIIGSPHLANNNRDLVNARIEDVTTTNRQREIEVLVEHLAQFRPTRIAIEWDAGDQSGLDRRYADYRSGRLTLTANERDQIALRLAAKLDLSRVDAIDWNGDPPGKEEAYNFMSWAAQNGQAGRLEKLRSEGQASTDAQTARWRCLPIADWYRELNTPAARASSHRAYYDIATIGNTRESPGAAWVGAWYARNLRIFNRIAEIAKPVDRVLVLYGSGHAYLLDQFARESAAFIVADTLSYLPAPQPRCP